MRVFNIAPREGTDTYRSEFRRDYARLIHSPAFRRLQGKTQLFPGVESDFFRNRLTHSIEVAQIAKTIAMKVNAEVKQLKNELSSCIRTTNTYFLRFMPYIQYKTHSSCSQAQFRLWLSYSLESL